MSLPLRTLLLLLLLLALPTGAEAGAWGWLGVRIRDLSEQEMDEISQRHGIREGFGALVVEVMADTPAARAGLQSGDLVVAFRGRPVVDTRTLQRLVARTAPGTEIPLTVLRGDAGRQRLPVRLGRMPPEIVAERVAGEFGFVVREPSGERGGAPARPPVALSVVAVEEGGPAERAGLRAGDLIVEINGRPVLSRQAASDALQEAGLDRPLRLSVDREGERRALTLAPPARRFP